MLLTNGKIYSLVEAMWTESSRLYMTKWKMHQFFMISIYHILINHESTVSIHEPQSYFATSPVLQVLFLRVQLDWAL